MEQRYVNGKFSGGKDKENSSFITGSSSGGDTLEKGGTKKELTLVLGEDGPVVDQLKLDNKEVDYEEVCPKAEKMGRDSSGILKTTGELGDPNGVVRMDYGDDRIR